MSKLYFHGGRKKKKRISSFKGNLSPAQIELSLSWSWAKAEQTNIWLTSDRSINSSCSIVVQYEKSLVLYLYWFNHYGPTNIYETFFQELNLDFYKIMSLLKFKSYMPHFLNSSYLYTLQIAIKPYILDISQA